MVTVEFDTPEDYDEFHRRLANYDKLEEKHWDECRQIAHYQNEANRLDTIQAVIDTAQNNLTEIKERRRNKMIGIAFAIAAGTGYIIGIIVGKRYAQQYIKEQRLNMGLNPENGKEE